MLHVGTSDDARVSTVVNTPKGRENKRDLSLPAVIPLTVLCSLRALNLIRLWALWPNTFGGLRNALFYLPSLKTEVYKPRISNSAIAPIRRDDDLQATPAV
jgi:hypothetical protein